MAFALIVEDDFYQADIFSTALTMAGFERVDVIRDGQEALAFLQQGHAPDLVVLDLYLPGAMGEKILEYIRSAEHLKKTRVILATGNPHMAAPLQAESDLVLIKPISFTQLRDLAKRLRQTLGN